MAHLLNPRKKAVWGRTQAHPPTVKKRKENKKKARKILCPSDITLEVHGDKDEVLEVKEDAHLVNSPCDHPLMYVDVPILWLVRRPPHTRSASLKRDRPLSSC